MILIIDNYDSFVHNLARYIRELGEDAVVRRNDALTLDQVAALGPSHIVLSPGPCTPKEAGISVELVRRLGAFTPILGVCLGHQCIGAAYGARVIRARRPVHGKTSPVSHDGSSIFAGLPSPLQMPTMERAFGVDELFAAREVLLTSSLRGVAPLVRVDAHAIGTGAPGAFTRQLAASYAVLVDEECAVGARGASG